MAYANIITTPNFNLSTLSQNIVAMHKTAKQRNTLARLTLAQLNDMGITREQQIAECNLRFWQ